METWSTLMSLDITPGQVGPVTTISAQRLALQGRVYVARIAEFLRLHRRLHNVDLAIKIDDLRIERDVEGEQPLLLGGAGFDEWSARLGLRGLRFLVWFRAFVFFSLQ